MGIPLHIRSERQANVMVICVTLLLFSFLLCDVILRELVVPTQTMLQSEANVLVEPAPEQQQVFCARLLR